MATIKKSLNLLLRGGLACNEFELVKEDATNENLRVIQIYAPVSCVGFCVLRVLSMLAPSNIAQNAPVYGGFCVLTGAMSVAAHLLARREHSGFAVNALIHAYMIALYVFSLLVAIPKPNLPTVSAIVFLMVVPLLFVCRPIGIMMQTACAVMAICVESAYVKPSVLAVEDMWNSVAFGTVSVVTNLFLMRTKFQSLFQAREIALLSETDLLTGLRNRNSYMNRLEDYPRKTHGKLICAYIDANGLHELNNTKGHDAGDALLVAIANEIRGFFGSEHSYRIGGDEFVAFVPEGSLEVTERALAELAGRLQCAGYSVSWGVSATDAMHANMTSVVREAEKLMYEQKFSQRAGRRTA